MKLGLKSKIYIGLLSLLLLFGSGIYFAASKIMREALLRENRNRGLLIVGNLAAWATEPILATDFLRLKNLVDEAILLDEDIHYAFILDTQQQILAHTFTGGFPIDLITVNTVPDSQKYSRRLLDTGSDRVYDYAAPVSIDGNRFGTVRLGLLQTRAQQAIASLSKMMLLSTTLVMVLAGLVGTVLARTVGKRIETLHRSIEQIMRGDLEVQTAPPLKKNCWDIMHCDKEECPAYNERHVRCWYLAGTMCPSCIEGEYAKKIESCLKCPVYRSCSGDEVRNLADSFDFMVRTLKNHLSELKTAETTLTEQRHLLKTILDATPDFVSLQDCDSVYRVVNKAFCELVGKSEEEISGKTDFDLFPRSRAESNRREDLGILESGEPFLKEDKITGSKGKRWIHMVKLPVRDGSGTIVGLLCSGRDITEFKRFQERLTQAQKMEAVGQLTAGIAHEINNPLQIILGYAQLLLAEVEPDNQMHADLQMIEKHTRICRKIVSDLLRFSYHTESSKAPMDINKAIEESVAVVEHTFRLERVLIHRRLDPSLPEITGDEEKLKQVVVNLVKNAFDAIGTDGLILISSTFEEQSGELLISVADTGSGIPPEIADRIFDPFFTTKGVGKGTGLGLSVTFGIVKEHGGRIEVQSPLPVALIEEMEIYGVDKNTLKGTVFTIHLPVERPERIAQKEEAHGEHSYPG